MMQRPTAVKMLALVSAILGFAACLGAQQLSGYVQSPEGVRLPGIAVIGFPEVGGVASSTKSLDDGSFVLALEQDTPYSCVARLAGTSFGWNGSKYFAPGTANIVLTLVPDVLTRFEIVDAHTGKPVEKFSLSITRNNGTRGGARTVSSRGGQVEKHPNGVLQTGARPGLDTYKFYARGYDVLSGGVAHEDDRRTQTIRVTPSPSIGGKLPRSGYVVKGKRWDVVVAPAFPSDPRTLASYNRRDAGSSGANADWKSNFRVTSLDADVPYVLFSNGGERGVIYRKNVRAQSPGNDLGKLEYTPWARLEGHVILPEGVAARATLLYVDAWDEDLMSRISSDGSFVFEQIAPGEHTLRARSESGDAISNLGFHVKLESGKTGTVTIDLSK